MRFISGAALIACVAILNLAGAAGAAGMAPGSARRDPDAVPAVADAAKPVYRWQETGVKSFYGTDASTKTQGIASDGESIFFSSNSGIFSSNLAMDLDLADNFFAIPPDLMDGGSNHIGDIDYYDGWIYAPIEDGPGYNKPTAITYDPQTLQPGPERYVMNTENLKNGFPWIAIDAVRQVAYTGAWNNTGILNVHQLSDFAITSTVVLDRAVPRIQGAAIYKGFLYAARDDGAEKEIIAIDPVTGHVSHLFDRNFGIYDEVEGMTFVQNTGGTTMVTLDIVGAGTNQVDVHSYRLNGDVDPPVTSIDRVLKDQIRPGGALKVSLTSSEKVTTDADWWRCVGSRKHPCRRTRPVGPAQLDQVRSGSSWTRIPSRKLYAPEGKFLNPGVYMLVVTPTDQADAVGKPTSAAIRILAPGATTGLGPKSHHEPQRGGRSGPG